jgi:hypothetical protein
VRCHRAALKSDGENVEVTSAGLLFICSADKLTSAIDIAKPNREAHLIVPVRVIDLKAENDKALILGFERNSANMLG